MFQHVTQTGTLAQARADALARSTISEKIGVMGWRTAANVWALAGSMRPGIVTVEALSLPLMMLTHSLYLTGALLTLSVLFSYDIAVA
mgnify:CR=1 FL=1